MTAAHPCITSRRTGDENVITSPTLNACSNASGRQASLGGDAAMPGSKRVSVSPMAAAPSRRAKPRLSTGPQHVEPDEESVSIEVIVCVGPDGEPLRRRAKGVDPRR